MSCEDDLTADDLTGNVSVQVLERNSAGVGASENLWGYIDHARVSGVNLEVPESAASIVKTWDDRHTMDVYCDSGVDDQMIIHIPFINSLRLRTLLVLPPQPTNNNRPTRIRLFTNLPHPPSFSDVEDMQPVQDIDISTSPSAYQITAGAEGRDSAGRREVEEWPLKVQKMASVFSVTLVVSDAEGGDRSRLYYLGFKGESRQTRRGDSELGTVPAANAADTPVKPLSEQATSGSTQIR